MGVPKFYRWMSERYPCLSEVVREYQIPEFDNLYLDMNGIIHNCSHPNDEDVHFRISEEKIFQDIFRYIEFLFRMIKPRKVFFMAIDGVAPRAKMNQQRGRRFRSAKEAEVREEEAKQKGETLPTEKRFDSNCITPGTDFMDRLHQHLKYFVAHKISTDDLWRGVRVILSGHETPGEGEHKVMDFIRFEKSQPNYDPNTRHCLYGLDADLIMLGMCSHEPHFSLLREEVKYIRSKTDKNKRDSNPEAITFHLLHLSLFREYIDHEFEELKTTLPFRYNLENILDDWVLMGFLVGNDFIPHIPHFHINKSSLLKLYSVYKKVMPTLDGYLNEDGKLNLHRFQVYINELTHIDIDNFNDTYADLKYFESKTGRKLIQRDLKDTSAFFEGEGAVGGAANGSKPKPLIDIANSDNESDNNFDDEDVYQSTDSEEKDMFMEEFKSHKRDYYMTKLNYEEVDESVLKEQAHEYIRAIQWNLHYYYDGCMSWSWFYPHHYAPYISDVHDFDDINLSFDFGEPFKPFEQLLAVLPAASKELLPKAFEALVSNPSSQLIDYYPEDFETDQNEKQQAWEAVVLIPFIDEKRLLNAVKSLEKNLNKSEVRRNSHGPHLVFTYSEQPVEPIKSPNSSIFPDIIQNHSKCLSLDKEAFWLPKELIFKGLCKGVRLDVYVPGFPTLQHIPHDAVVKKERVRVFESASNGENMMLIIKNQMSFDITYVIENYLNKTVFVNWPHLLEALVFRVSDGQNKYFMSDNQVFSEEIDDDDYKDTTTRIKHITKRYKERWGVVTGEPDIVLHVYPMTGRKYVIGDDGNLTLEKQWSNQPMLCPIQTVVKDLNTYEKNDIQFQTIQEIFTPGAKCFPIDNPYYGSTAVVKEFSFEERVVKVEVFPQLEPDLREIQERAKEIIHERYIPNYVLAQRLGISGHLCSRLLGTIFIKLSDSDHKNRINIGLNLKFNARNEEVPGYSIKRDDTWLFSDKVFKIFNDYLTEFPFIFDKLSTCVEKDYFSIEDLIPGENKHKTLEKLVNWLKSLESTQEKRQKCNAEILDEFVVEAIEDVINTHIVFPKELSPVVQSYRLNQLFRPIHYLGYSLPDPKAKYELFDRVVNIRSGISVPLGAKGTIIGKYIDPEKEVNTLFDIVFDEEFVGGTKLRCTQGKGYKLSPASLINITFGLKISGKYEQFVSCGQPIQTKPQPNHYPNRQNHHYRDQNNQRFQFNYSYGQRMPRPRFNGPPPFNVTQNAVSPQTAISIQTLNHSKTSPFQSPKHEHQKNDDFPPMEQLWNALTQMQTNSNSLPKTSFADITAQKKLPNNQNLTIQQKEGTDRNKSNPRARNQRSVSESKSTEQHSGQHSGHHSGQQNRSNKPKVQLYETFRQILSKTCEQFFNQSPRFEILKTGPMASKSIKLILPDSTQFIVLINSHPSIDEAYEFISRMGLVSINSKFNANIDLNRPEKLLSIPDFVAPNQTSPNRPRVAESSLPRPPPKWINKPQVMHRHDPRPPPIPDSFVEHNERMLKEVQKQRNYTSRVNTSTSANKDRNIQPKKLFETRNDNLVSIPSQQTSSQNRNKTQKIQNNVTIESTSQRKVPPNQSRNSTANQSAFDHQFVPLQVARNNQSQRPTPQKSSAQKPKESKTLIEIASNSSDDVEILTPESIVRKSNTSSTSKNSSDEIEILTPDSLRATGRGSSGRRSNTRKPRMGANLN